MIGLKKRLFTLLGMVLTAALLVTGCGSKSAADPAREPGQDRQPEPVTQVSRKDAVKQQNALKAIARKDGEKLRILTSFFPMYVMTLNVARGVPDVTVTNLTAPQTGCLHDYSLTAEDMKKLAGADVFIANGGGMESFLAKAVEANKRLAVVTASAGIPLIREGGEINPHVWLRIASAREEVAGIARSLAALDPANAGAYRRNAREYDGQLAELQQYAGDKLKELKSRDIVTFHEAFPYFAQEQKLNIVRTIRREPGTEPTPKELEETIASVKALPVKVLCVEPQYPAGAAETIARETGATIVVLDPCVTGEAGPEAENSYLETMKKNIDTLYSVLK